MKKIIIAIDGYSGTGKSSTAKVVANKLGYLYIDSGAMYRATTLFFLERHIDHSSLDQVAKALSALHLSFDESGICVNEKNVSRDIRTMKVNEAVSHVAAIKEVRLEMVRQQRAIGVDKAVVMDGRDIGTVVFPEAELKIFMTADANIRAQRRQSELNEKGIVEDLNLIKENLLERDQLDSNRAESPLRKAADAFELDTSGLTFDDQVSKIVELAKAKINDR